MPAGVHLYFHCPLIAPWSLFCYIFFSLCSIPVRLIAFILSNLLTLLGLLAFLLVIVSSLLALSHLLGPLLFGLLLGLIRISGINLTLLRQPPPSSLSLSPRTNDERASGRAGGWVGGWAGGRWARRETKEQQTAGETKKNNTKTAAIRQALVEH